MTRAHLAFASQILAHVPDLVLSGSKPRREIALDASLSGSIAGSLRTTEEAARYLPNQIFLGAREPQCLSRIPSARGGTPCLRGVRLGGSQRRSLLRRQQFLAALQAVDATGLLALEDDRMSLDGALRRRSLVESLRSDRTAPELLDPMPIPARDGSLGEIGWGYAQDDSLSPRSCWTTWRQKRRALLPLLIFSR